MLNILSVLKFIDKAVKAKDPRYHVLDDEHILDANSGIELHMYDEWFKVTHNDETIATKTDFTRDEQEVVWSIKQSISDPENSIYIAENYSKLQKERREKLSSLLEDPSPVARGLPSAEEGTTEYQG